VPGQKHDVPTKRPNTKWGFKARFRRRAFGWRSQPAIKRIKEAVSEIRRAARSDELLAAEGAVVFLERLSPALENVDSSSGAIGTAVNNAIVALVPIIANAPASGNTRGAWLERLYDAYQDDDIPYIELLGDYWGELCASKAVASEWADRLIERAARSGAGWAPPGPPAETVSSIVSFAKAAERTGYADPRQVDEYLREGISAFLRRDYVAAFDVFRCLLVPIGDGEIDLGQDELVEEVLSVDPAACAAMHVVAAYMSAEPIHRADTVSSAIDDVRGFGHFWAPLREMEGVALEPVLYRNSADGKRIRFNRLSAPQKG